jgi:hypothetical protein
VKHFLAIALLLVMIIAVSGIVLAHSPQPPVQPTLEAPKMFALGPVGFGGKVSEEEHQFKAILALEPAQAKQKLEKLYSSGNPQAMSYALAGMRKLDRKRYSELSVSARTSDLIVTTMRGCIMSQEKLRTVADDLDSGIYDVWLR